MVLYAGPEIFPHGLALAHAKASRTGIRGYSLDAIEILHGPASHDVGPFNLLAISHTRTIQLQLATLFQNLVYSL